MHIKRFQKTNQKNIYILWSTSTLKFTPWINSPSKKGEILQLIEMKVTYLKLDKLKNLNAGKDKSHFQSSQSFGTALFVNVDGVPFDINFVRAMQSAEKTPKN